MNSNYSKIFNNVDLFQTFNKSTVIIHIPSNMKYWSESNKLPFDQFLNNRLGRVWEFLDHFLQDLRANVPTLLQNASLTYHHQYKGYICKENWTSQSSIPVWVAFATTTLEAAVRPGNPGGRISSRLKASNSSPGKKNE